MRALVAMVLLVYLDPTLAIPYLISPSPGRHRLLHSEARKRRQHPPRQFQSLEEVQIPQCALSCYLRALPTDGCALEVDLRCHCSTGNILGRSEACVKATCSKADRESAENKVVKACQMLGINIESGNDDGGSGSGRSERPVSTSANSISATATDVVEVTSNPPIESSSPTPVPTQELPSKSTFSTSSTGQTSASSPSATETTSQPSPTASSTPTNTPLPSTHSLSTGAKAGIFVSIILLAVAIIAALFLYIRRLKRQLALAKAAATATASIPQASQTTTSFYIPTSSSRHRSSPTSPISPLSPLSLRETRRSSFSALLGSQKRGPVLSVVVEQDDEDTRTLVREPVPGQAEGLVGPLELDGESSGVMELPTSVTPQEREEAEGWMEYNFGEADVETLASDT